jgi:signal transduction histidine kinase
VTALAMPPAAPTILGIDDLRELMRSVNETTERLQDTHSALHGRVAQLQRELAEANAQLRRSRALAALGEMAAGIAHEIRNPLGSIRLDVQMLSEDLSGAPPQAQLCARIAAAVHRLDAIVVDVLRFARDAELRPEPTSAAQLFELALGACARRIDDAAVAVSYRAPRSVRLRADVSLMTQALSNVIVNAIEAMAESAERRLVLRAARRMVRGPDGTRAPRVVLSVADTGLGIPEAALERMFNPFFTTRPAGTGLGLAIVHRIVDAHGGHVAACNRPEGGACLELCLPPDPSEGEA